MALSLQAGSAVSGRSFSGFTGLRADAPSAAKVTPAVGVCRCTACKKLGVRAAASSSHNDASAAQSSGVFASVSQTAPAAPAPASGGGVFPALLGAGAIGAAAYFVVKQTVSSSGSVKTEVVTAPPPAKSTAPAESVVFVPPYVPRAKSAAPTALATMAGTFPNAIQEETFVKAVAAELANLGFKRDNCIALVNTCRDEVCRPIVNLIDREFGLSFNIAGLGGLVNCGKTGFKAAMSHSPVFPNNVDGKEMERYIFFAFPHVSIGESGEVGSLLRRGRGKPSSACGALIAIKNDITNGGPVTEDAQDAEYVLLKKKVIAKIEKPTSGGPSLVQTTKAALAAINDDLEKLISLTVDPATADYAVITGVQIHSGNQVPGEAFRIERTCDYIAPDKMYAVVRGQRYNLQLETKSLATA